jgi:signal transduction histidine kinase
MLGHDMRSPLQTIQVTAAYLSQLNAGAEVSKASSLLISSGASIQALLEDLIDFNRTKIGLGISIVPAHSDLAEVFVDKLKQLRATYGQHQVELEVSGEVRGVWDARRLQQLLGNLVENAIKYGAADRPIRVAVSGRESDVLFEVRNSGPAIEPSTLIHMFDPLVRGATRRERQDHAGLGLGLYIAREIAKAHGGEIEAQSDETETVFAVRLPRRQPPEA